MINQETYDIVIQTLGEAIKARDTEITLLKWQVTELENAIKAAEESAKAAHACKCMAASADPFVERRSLNE